jgi:cytochrome c556
MLVLVAGALAPGVGVSGVIEERQALMRRLAGDLQTIWDGLARGDGAAVQGGARGIAAETSKLLGLFPPDSFHGPSRARPAIAAEFSDFKALLRGMQGAAEALAASAEGGALDEVRPHLTRLVQTCRQCHRSYVRY